MKCYDKVFLGIILIWLIAVTCFQVYSLNRIGRHQHDSSDIRMCFEGDYKGFLETETVECEFDKHHRVIAEVK